MSFFKFLSKTGVETTRTFDFKLDYGVRESVIHLRADGNACMSLHVACKLHAVIESRSRAFFLPFFGNFYKFGQWEATCIVRRLR